MAMMFDDAGDRRIVSVETGSRRVSVGASPRSPACRSMGSARESQTGSLQATPMAERADAAPGFRDLGRILGYVPNGGK